MKKQFFTLASLLVMGISAHAQVGIGTTLPAATLDVTGTPATATVLDGIIAPRLSGAQLRAKAYTTAQRGAMVYVTTADTAPAGQTIDVTAAGQYYFNGTKWVSMGAVAFTEADGIIGNEVTNITANGGLTRAGSGTTVSPYTLGLTSGTTSGQLMTWNGTAWMPAAATNIYSADGLLSGYRNLNLNGSALNFIGSGQQTTMQSDGSLYLIGTSGTKRSSLILNSEDNNSNGIRSGLYLSQDPENSSQIFATNDSYGLQIGTSNTVQPSGIAFVTTPTNGVNAVQKMWLTAAGNLGINQYAPAAKLHVIKGASEITPAIIEGCNTYTDNTAAATAGVPIGGLYKKADGTLMVRQ